MILLSQIQERLIEAIRNSGLKQTELAKKINIKQPTLAQYLSGRSLPALDTFANLCAVLDEDPSYILCLDTPTTSQEPQPYIPQKPVTVTAYLRSKDNASPPIQLSIDDPEELERLGEESKRTKK